MWQGLAETFPLLFSKRIRCFLRLEYPLLPFLVFLILGELVGYWCAYFYHLEKLKLIFFVLIVLIGSLWRVARILPFLIGVILTVPVLIAQFPLAENNRSYLATVNDDPRHSRPGAVELELDLKSRNQKVEYGLAHCRAIYLPWKNISTIKRGDTFVMRATFSPIELPFNPFSYQARQRRHMIHTKCSIMVASRALRSAPYFFSVLRRWIFESILEKFGMNNREGLFLSMVLGFRDLISLESTIAFQRTGLAHLLVVSGFHVTLIFSTILFFVRFLVSKLFAHQPNLLLVTFVTSLLISILFVMLIGIDGASLRAAIAICIVCISALSERGRGMVHGIQAALLVLVIIWPGCFLEPGVQLTFAALIGIAYGLSVRTPFRWYRTLVTLIVPSFATFGISLCWFGSASLIGIVLNPVLAPLASVVFTLSGLVSLALYLCHIDGQGALLSVVLLLIDYFNQMILYFSSFEYAALEFEGNDSIIYGVAAIVCFLLLLLKRIKQHLVEMGIVYVR